jgi:hypothetical protein
VGKGRAGGGCQRLRGRAGEGEGVRCCPGGAGQGESVSGCGGQGLVRVNCKGERLLKRAAEAEDLVEG